MIWSHGDNVSPTQDRSPNDYGWITNGELLQLEWYDGPAVPEMLFTNPEEDNRIQLDHTDNNNNKKRLLVNNVDSESEFSSDNEQWSEDSSYGLDLDDDF